MRATRLLVVTATLVLGAQLGAQQDADRTVINGGIFVAGWRGKVDVSSALQLRTTADARFAEEDGALHITTGPAVTYWNPANTAAGDYTVSATFLEPRFMELSSHPHSYGLFIGGTDMGSERMRLLYCVTYGDGAGLIRGFGPAVFTIFGPSSHVAINRANAVGEPVTNLIALTVHDGGVECRVNGVRVAALERGQVVATDRLRSTDGVYGIRLTHNVEAIVTGLRLTAH